MRVHPISLALQYLKGRRKLRGGRVAFTNEDEAVATLRMFTGQDFGMDANRWGAWLRQNRWVYYASSDDPRLTQPRQ